MIEKHIVSYSDKHKFRVHLKKTDNSKCRHCLCLDCDNGCHNIVCEALCKNNHIVVECGDFEDDWY